MKKPRKVFIAINIDSKARRYIEKKLDRIKEETQSVSKIHPENYHITLRYVGFISDEELVEACDGLKKALKDVAEFDLSLHSFFWGPTEEKAKMLWIIGEKSRELINLEYLIRKATGAGDAKGTRGFKPHINLGWINKKRIDPNKKIEKIKEKINLSISVSSVDIMESLKEEGKSRYYILERIELL